MLLPSPNLLTEPLVLQARGTHTHIQTHIGRLRLSALSAWLLGQGRRERAIGQKAGAAEPHNGTSVSLSFLVVGWIGATCQQRV